jgi:hypothetical protein
METAIVLETLLAEQRKANSPWLNADEAADYLRVSVSQLNKWRGVGQISAYYGEGMSRPRYRREELDAILAKK